MQVDALANRPLVGAIIRRQAFNAFLGNRDQNMFWGVHESWDAASAAAQSFGREGYDNSDSAQIYQYRTRMDQHDYPSLYWLARSLDEGLSSVFDVGGAIGIKYLAFRDHLSKWGHFDWCVQDVPAMVVEGQRQSKIRGDSEFLSFTDKFSNGDGRDVLFASGVLQYLPNTLDELLKGWGRLPKRIIINTAAIHPERSFFTVNSLGTAFCPYRVQTQASLIRGLSALGYKIRDGWSNPDKPMLIPFHPELSLSAYSGYCLDLCR